MEERSFKSSGIRIGRIFGIEFWLHWSLLVWLAYVLYLSWIQESTLEMLLGTFIWWLAILLTISIHELGHCYAAYRQGGGADAVVLWLLGGLAYCDAPRLPRNQFWVAAGGPLMQLAPTALAGAGHIFLRLGSGPFPSAGESYLGIALGAFFWWNVTLLAFNLLPVYPLDGGRMLQAVLWGKLQSYGRATLLTVWTSRAVIFAAALAMLFLPRSASFWSWPVLLILAWSFFETERLRVRLLAGEEEDYAFGYDFSRGYTSLDRTSGAARGRTKAGARSRPSLWKRIRERLRESRAARAAQVRERVDSLLEKIAKEGMPSLTRSERRFLEQASKRFQKREN